MFEIGVCRRRTTLEPLTGRAWHRTLSAPLLVGWERLTVPSDRYQDSARYGGAHQPKSAAWPSGCRKTGRRSSKSEAVQARRAGRVRSVIPLIPVSRSGLVFLIGSSRSVRVPPRAGLDGTRVIETPTAKLSLRDDGIVHAINLTRSQVTLADAKENVAAALKVAGGKRFPLLADIASVRSVSREARLYYREQASSHAVAAAILVRSPISRVIANFVIGLDRPVIPARLFTSETEALEWLKGFLE